MGDVPSRSQKIGRPQNMAQPSRQESQPPSIDIYEDSEAPKEQSGPRSHSNFSQSQPYLQQQYSSQTRPEFLNMNSLAATLPDLSYQNYGTLQHQTQRFASGPSSAGGVYQFPNVQQFTGAQPLPTSGSSQNSQYNLPYQGQYQTQFPGMYTQSHTPSPPHLQQAGSPTSNQFYQSQGFMGQQHQQHQQGSQYLVQPSQYSPHGHMYPTMPSAGQYGTRHGFSGDSRFQSQPRSNELGFINSGGGTAKLSHTSKCKI